MEHEDWENLENRESCQDKLKLVGWQVTSIFNSAGDVPADFYPDADGSDATISKKAILAISSGDVVTGGPNIEEFVSETLEPLARRTYGKRTIQLKIKNQGFDFFDNRHGMAVVDISSLGARCNSLNYETKQGKAISRGNLRQYTDVSSCYLTK